MGWALRPCGGQTTGFRDLAGVADTHHSCRRAAAVAARAAVLRPRVRASVAHSWVVAEPRICQHLPAPTTLSAEPLIAPSACCALACSAASACRGWLRGAKTVDAARRV